ncbi:PREDICTED: ubiquitin carboxyl-terminal hydrolase 19-like [Priapulus caudatus]|uniref:Ubiquitin carboxyl-terminal hydrolase 19-like n=1 Tax=Priapulus caudatus TaxID=37621 RepID=A0ABM1EUX6_PRICU|nr:PREDICTED: ubiquitin carboxyl-terminal hydrolase 19-like [Priapulus caudatus]
MEKASLETESEKSPKLSRNTDDESEKEGLLEVCGWTQDERHVKVNIDVGAGVASEDVDVIIETNLCHVKLKDGRKWRCDLFAPIQEEGSTVQHEGSTVRLTLVKFEPNVHWQQLQEKLPVMEAEKEKESEATDKPPRTYAISLAKHNWYEKAGFMVVNVYVKRTRKDVVKIDFQESSFQVIFATADEKFLSMHEDTDKDTIFSWTVML